MDQGTAEAISVIEKQMAEQGSKIAAHDTKIAALEAAVDRWTAQLMATSMTIDRLRNTLKGV